MDREVPAVENDAADLVSLTADVVSAYVSNNTVPATEIAGLIASVHGAFGSLGSPQEPAAPTYEPAVSIKKSVTPDALISLIDGKSYRTLKRHLSGHGLTPDGYRKRYSLPHDYPMSAPNYSAQRSELAKRIGLGDNRRKAAAREAEADPIVAEPVKQKRGRKPAA